MKKLISYLLFLLLITQGCGVHNSLRFSKVETQKSKQQTAPINKELSQTKHITNDEASVNSNVYVQPQKHVLIERIPKDTLIQKCDVILLKTGEEIEAKVTEIGTDEIKYKKCSYQDGPTYSIKKSTVFRVKYSNGSIDLIKHEPETKQNVAQEDSKVDKDEYNGTRRLTAGGIVAVMLVVFGTIFMLLLFWPAGFLSIGAIIASSVSIGKVVRRPKEFRGLGVAIVGLIFAILLLIFTTILAVGLLVL
jgi:hypothetical protein